MSQETIVCIREREREKRAKPCVRTQIYPKREKHSNPKGKNVSPQKCRSKKCHSEISLGTKEVQK